MLKKIIHYSFILGLLLFLTILYKLNFREILHIFRMIFLPFLVIGVFFTVLELVFKAQKLKLVTGVLKPITFLQAMEVYLIGLPYGLVTPGKVGDIVKLYTLKRKSQLPRTDCIAIGLVERLLETIALVGLAGIGVFMLLGHLTHQQIVALMFCIVFLFVGMFAILNQKLVHAVLRPFFYLIVPEHKQEKPRALFYDLYGQIDRVTQKRGTMAISLLLCILGWFAGSIRAYYFAEGLGIYELHFIPCLFLIPLVSVIELIPISILGVGTRDYALVTLLTMLGISHNVVMEQAVSLSLVLLVLGPIPPAIIGYILAIKEHVKWKDVTEGKDEDNEKPETN